MYLVCKPPTFSGDENINSFFPSIQKIDPYLGIEEDIKLVVLISMMKGDEWYKRLYHGEEVQGLILFKCK